SASGLPLYRIRVRASAGHYVPTRAQTAARTPFAAQKWPDHRAAILGYDVSDGEADTTRLCSTDARTPDRIGGQAADQRCAVRCVSLRWVGFKYECGTHELWRRGTHQDVFVGV